MGSGAAALLVLGLLSVFSGGDGIHCHICNSDQQEGCNDPFKATGDPIACETDTESHEGTLTGLPTGNTTDNQSGQPTSNTTDNLSGEPPAKCLKVIYAVKGKKMTERGCTVNPQQQLSCDDVVHAISADTKSGTDIELSFCEVCENDGCNRAAPGGPSLAAPGALSLIVALTSRRGFIST